MDPENTSTEPQSIDKIKVDEENVALLRELHQNEKALNHSIREQLEKARKTKTLMEADLESRAQKFEKSLGITEGNQKNDEMSTLLSTNDQQQLKQHVQRLFEQCRQQQTQIKKLEFNVEMEHGHVNILQHDNQTLKQLTVNMTALAEQEEEYISNKLLKRITGLKKEKSELLVQVEQEEEYMTNMLQKKLNRLQKEKIDMENALEQEQEFIVNKLQKQLDALRAQQKPKSTVSSPRSILQDVTPGTSPAFTTHPSPALSAKKWNVPSASSSSSVYNDPSSSMIEMLLAEMTTLKNKSSDMEREFLLKTQQCNKYKGELVQFRKQYNMPTDDIPLDEGIPAVFRSIPPSPGRQARAKRSTSTSSQRSVASEKTGGGYSSIPPLQLDGTLTSPVPPPSHHDLVSMHSPVGPQYIPGDVRTPRSRSSNH
ncbi:hypothetical protein BCR42DRAFT_401997 [Absidia repens]|uniref:Coiled-coil domain-containing protein 6 n=1 Tax=Absidia repens TaxID=90262 RepID=A0A1X2IXD7_9FUNG|nr:hypothetical protein BCR42DRAFT_401997 [Absidia repens]